MSHFSRSTPNSTGSPLAVALIGRGAIGRHLESLASLYAPVIQIIGAIHRDEAEDSADFADVLERAGIFVECASVEAVAEWAPLILGAGKPLVITSIGALADVSLRTKLDTMPGTYWLTTGAIGGLDLIRAAALTGGLDGIRITTTKRAQAFDPTMVAGLGEAKRTLFEGTPEEAIVRFPATANVTVALSLAAPNVPVEVRVVTDGRAQRTVHHIHAWGAAGEYEFRIENEVNPQNPKSSGLTARSLLSALLTLTATLDGADRVDPRVRTSTRFI